MIVYYLWFPFADRYRTFIEHGPIPSNCEIYAPSESYLIIPGTISPLDP